MDAPIEVWRTDFASLPALADCDLASLDDAERARLAGQLDPRAARRFALTRALLRRLLGQRLGIGAAQVPIRVGPHGKPFCPAAPTLGFNVSHSERSALVAIGEGREVGVDVESLSSFDASAPLWPLACADAECRWLERHRENADRAFAALWTRKEALLKAAGTGLRAPPTGIDLSAQMLAEAGGATWRTSAGAATAAWQTLALGPDQRGAVAVLDAPAGRSLRVTVHDFDVRRLHRPQ
jgi:4'-phosphopantetheinyl transferase